ncbi:CHRD domain-containing protein, partial [Pseudonocardia sp. KRD-188]
MRRTVRRVAILTALTTSAVALSAGVASAQDADVPEPSSFTSMFTAMATPDMVVNADGVATPGEPGATGTFDYRLNSDEEIICYDIILRGVTPPYMSPARTATHIHQADEGTSGPPRIAFPNPEDAGDGTLRSEGCMQGPFTTGIMANGADTGEGFSLAAIEADPAAFFTDTHTATFVAGAVRGQLSSVPMGGVATGAGGTADGGSWAPAAL